MSRRTHTWNGYESKLATGLLAGEVSTSVESALGLTEPVYLCLDPDVPDKREWVKVLSITGNSFDTMERGLEGSVGALGVGVDHATGALVRAVTTAQFMDDVFDDIEDLETVTADLPGTYLALDGSNAMAAPLTLQAGAPTLTDEATNKEYVDAKDTGVGQTAAAYADSLDHDHATPIAAHAAIVDVHHTRYTDGEVLGVTDPLYVKLSGGSVILGDLNTTGLSLVDEIQVRPGATDFVFRDVAGAELLRFDANQFSGAGEWEMKRNLDMENHFLHSPLDPTSSAHVGDRGFNDGRYSLGSHTHAYLPLAGGTLTGTLIAQSITPAVNGARSLGSTNNRWQTLWLSNEGIHWGNNDTIEYDDGNNEWKFKPDGTLRTILGANVSRFSGAITYYTPMATFSSGGYATLRRRDSDGRILELSSHPDTKRNMRTPERFAQRARQLVQRANGYIYGDADSPDEDEIIGLNSLEVAEVFPEMTHMVDGVPRSINYDMLVTPMLEVLRDYEARLHDLEAAH